MLLVGASLIGQTLQKPTCVLDMAKDGAFLTIRGVVFPTGHDIYIRPSGCEISASNRVIIVWGDDPSLNKEKLDVRRDAEFVRYDKLLGEKFPLAPNMVGVGRSRYRVTADFEGRLDIAPYAGLTRNPKNKKPIGIAGFGHPMPFTRFRLVARSVSNVEATEQEPPAQSQADHAPVAPAKKP